LNERPAAKRAKATRSAAPPATRLPVLSKRRQPASSPDFAGFRKAMGRPLAASGSQPVSIWNAGPFHCRFPVTEVSPIDEFRFCGARTQMLFGYCPEHADRMVRGRHPRDAADRA
jgi:hypothetical protein